MPNTLIFMAWAAMTVTSIVVIAFAVALYLRDVLRRTEDESQEPSPISKRVAPFMLIGILVGGAIHFVRGDRLVFTDIIFPAVFIGFALSAGWYLLSRRSSALADTPRLSTLSVLIVVSFAVLSALLTT